MPRRFLNAIQIELTTEISFGIVCCRLWFSLLFWTLQSDERLSFFRRSLGDHVRWNRRQMGSSYWEQQRVASDNGYITHIAFRVRLCDKKVSTSGLWPLNLSQLQDNHSQPVKVSPQTWLATCSLIFRKLSWATKILRAVSKPTWTENNKSFR